MNREIDALPLQFTIAIKRNNKLLDNFLDQNTFMDINQISNRKQYLLWELAGIGLALLDSPQAFWKHFQLFLQHLTKLETAKLGVFLLHFPQILQSKAHEFGLEVRTVYCFHFYYCKTLRML